MQKVLVVGAAGGIDQKICALGGLFCAVLFGVGLLLAGFVPPPSLSLVAAGVAAVWSEKSRSI